MKTIPELLENKIVLITGGSRGLGAELSKLFAAHGAKVAVNYLSQTEKAMLTLQSIWSANGEAIGCPTDVRDSAGVEAMVLEIQEKLGGYINVLINNAYPGTTTGNVQQSGWPRFETL
jgi:NAD(P)-dependent dehydrogenase (short-subunit alcohol dehydrogenase family)